MTRQLQYCSVRDALVEGVDEDVVGLNVPVHNSQVVHVEVNASAVESNFDSLRQGDLHVSLHVQHLEQAVVDKLVYYHDVWNGGAASH